MRGGDLHRAMLVMSVGRHAEDGEGRWWMDGGAKLGLARSKLMETEGLFFSCFVFVFVFLVFEWGAF